MKHDLLTWLTIIGFIMSITSCATANTTPDDEIPQNKFSSPAATNKASNTAAKMLVPLRSY